MRLPRSKIIALVLTLSLSFFTSLSFAAAFGIAEQSALGLDNAFAGGARTLQPYGITRRV